MLEALEVSLTHTVSTDGRTHLRRDDREPGSVERAGDCL